MEVNHLACIDFVLCASPLAILGQLVLHEFIPEITLLLEFFFNVRRAALSYVVFVQVFLEHLERNSHLLRGPFLEDFLSLNWKVEVCGDLSP